MRWGKKSGSCQDTSCLLAPRGPHMFIWEGRGSKPYSKFYSVKRCCRKNKQAAQQVGSFSVHTHVCAHTPVLQVSLGIAGRSEGGRKTPSPSRMKALWNHQRTRPPIPAYLSLHFLRRPSQKTQKETTQRVESSPTHLHGLLLLLP